MSIKNKNDYFLIFVQLSIESYQVAGSVEEACDYEGRQSANQFQHEREKSKKWRKTGTKTISKDFRDVY
jgi:hypothetical protein